MYFGAVAIRTCSSIDIKMCMLNLTYLVLINLSFCPNVNVVQFSKLFRFVGPLV